jgi:hypothetical protein
MQELRAGDLAETDRRDVAGVATESPVHLLVDTLGLQRRLIEMGLAQHGALAFAAFRRPGRPIAQFPIRLPFGRDIEEELERSSSIRDDAEIRREDAADLRRLDIHMYEFAAFRIGRDVAGMAVGPAVADAEDEVGGKQRRIAITMRGLQAAHAGHQRVVVGNGAPTHQGWNDRNAGDLGELDEQVRGIRIDDAAAGDDQRPFGRVQHRDRLFGLRAGRGRLVGRKRRIGLRIEFDLGKLDVDGQVDQHRTGSARTHQVERLLEDEGDERRLLHGDGPLGDRRGYGGDIDGLKILLVEARPRRLAGDAEDRDRIRRGRVEAGDHVGAGRPRGADTEAYIAVLRPCIALRHMRGAFDVAREDMADRSAPSQRRIKRIDRSTRHTESTVDPLLFQNMNCRIDGAHLGHGNSSCLE